MTTNDAELLRLQVKNKIMPIHSAMLVRLLLVIML